MKELKVASENNTGLQSEYKLSLSWPLRRMVVAMVMVIVVKVMKIQEAVLKITRYCRRRNGQYMNNMSLKDSTSL